MAHDSSKKSLIFFFNNIMAECATCCYSDGGGVYLLDRKGEDNTSNAVRAEYPGSLSPSISLHRSVSCESCSSRVA